MIPLVQGDFQTLLDETPPSRGYAFLGFLLNVVGKKWNFALAERSNDSYQRYCQLNEHSTLSTQFAWRESIELSGMTQCAPHVQSATSG